MNPRLRIAAHNGAPEWGGGEIALCRLLSGLQERGHDVRLYYNRDVVARGAAGYELETEHLHVGGDGMFHHGPRVARALRAWQPDVLVVGTFRKLLHLAVGARLVGVPVVSRIGQSTDLPRNAKYRFLFRHLVDCVAVSTRDIRDGYLERLPGLPPHRVRVVAKGVSLPTPIPDRIASRRELGLGERSFVVGALARLVPVKRLDRWIDVAGELVGDAAGRLTGSAEGGGDVIGLVAGDGPLRAELEARARERGIPVRFTGHLEDPSRALAAMDVLLVTSDRESLANAMLEALAHGVPVVSTPVSGAHAALDGTEDRSPPGIVTADFRTETLARAMEALRHDPTLRAQMARAARLRAERRFGKEAMLDGWEPLLTEAARR